MLISLPSAFHPCNMYLFIIRLLLNHHYLWTCSWSLQPGQTLLLCALMALCSSTSLGHNPYVRKSWLPAVSTINRADSKPNHEAFSALAVTFNCLSSCPHWPYSQTLSLPLKQEKYQTPDLNTYFHGESPLSVPFSPLDIDPLHFHLQVSSFLVCLPLTQIWVWGWSFCISLTSIFSKLCFTVGGGVLDFAGLELLSLGLWSVPGWVLLVWQTTQGRARKQAVKAGVQ